MFKLKTFPHKLRKIIDLTKWSPLYIGIRNSSYNVLEFADQQTDGCHVPKDIPKPPYAVGDDESSAHSFIRNFFSNKGRNSLVKDDTMVKYIHEACRVGRRVLNHVKFAVKAGISTADLDFIAHQLICDNKAYPSPLQYKTFPKSICTSVNNVVVHGIPDSRKLMDGDIINIDISVYLNGVHGDLSETFLVGEVDTKGRHLVDITRECLDNAISICGPGQKLNTIGKSISELSQKHGFSVCPHYVGHGIGEEFHESPQILHHDNSYPGTMVPGMVFTIEPVICEGSSKVEYWNDGWTVVTADKRRAAQFEHTICITDTGVDVLTRNDLCDEFLQPNVESIEQLMNFIYHRCPYD